MGAGEDKGGDRIIVEDTRGEWRIGEEKIGEGREDWGRREQLR